MRTEHPLAPFPRFQISEFVKMRPRTYLPGEKPRPDDTPTVPLFRQLSADEIVRRSDEIATWAASQVRRTDEPTEESDG